MRNKHSSDKANRFARKHDGLLTARARGLGNEDPADDVAEDEERRARSAEHDDGGGAACAADPGSERMPRGVLLRLGRRVVDEHSCLLLDRVAVVVGLLDHRGRLAAVLRGGDLRVAVLPAFPVQREANPLRSPAGWNRGEATSRPRLLNAGSSTPGGVAMARLLVGARCGGARSLAGELGAQGLVARVSVRRLRCPLFIPGAPPGGGSIPWAPHFQFRYA